MKDFKQIIVESLTKEIETDEVEVFEAKGKPVLEIKLDDGVMKVYVEQGESMGTVGSWMNNTIEYDGKVLYYTAGDTWTATKNVKGDASKLLNALIQQLFVDSKITAK